MGKFIMAMVAGLMALVMATVAPAQDAVKPEDAWQAVVTHQIDAFRSGDATGAFSDAAQSFQDSIPNAGVFYQSIVSMGYAPIVTSKGHSFGKFELDPGTNSVLQIVKFVGPNQELFEALYNLTLEDAGWRVSGVMLRAPSGVGV